jgi:hypothetical protein
MSPLTRRRREMSRMTHLVMTEDLRLIGSGNVLAEAIELTCPARQFAR